MIKKFSRIAEHQRQNNHRSPSRQASKRQFSSTLSLHSRRNGKGRLLFNVKYIKKLCSALFTSKKPAKKVFYTQKMVSKLFLLLYCAKIISTTSIACSSFFSCCSFINLKGATTNNHCATEKRKLRATFSFYFSFFFLFKKNILGAVVVRFSHLLACLFCEIVESFIE